MTTRVLIETALGDITIALADASAPFSAAYFLSGVRDGVYDGTRFFRVVHPDGTARGIEIVQGGHPPPPDGAVNRSLRHETTASTGLRHIAGTISLARFAPGEVYHSFFICLRDEPALDRGGERQPDGQGFAAFGRTVSGLEVMRQVYARSAGAELPIDPVTITRVQLVGGRSGHK